MKTVCPHCGGKLYSKMNDHELLNWLEQTKAQLWWNEKSRLWTVFLDMEDEAPIQPSRAALRAGISDARELWRNRKNAIDK